MADSQIPTQPQVPKPETASRSDHRRWWEVVERAQVAVAEKPVMALSSESNTGPAVTSTRTVDSALTPESVTNAHPKGDTPWTGEAAPEAAVAKVVVDSAESGAGVGARSLLPERPWGNPRLRLAFWLASSVILVAAAVVLLLVSSVASILVWVVAIVAVVRALRGAYVSGLEQRIERKPRAARTVNVEPPRSPGDGPASGEAPGNGPSAAV